MGARLRRLGFWRGIVAGVLLVVALRILINETTLAEWIVSPLLTMDTGGQAAAIVVLGAGVLQGCVPNENGVRRVLLGARLWRHGRAPMLIFAGGSGSCPVAEAMANLAREIGVPDRAIRLETASVNTWENGALLAPRLRGWGVHSVLLVTDRLHMRRATGVFARLGFDVGHVSVSIAEGHADNVSMLRAGLREFVALAYYRARGWVGEPLVAPAATVIATPVPFLGGGSGTMVLLGASYAAGWTPGAVGGIPVINRGIAGEQSFEMLARFDADVVAAQPRAVILWGFINDIFRAPDGDVDAALARTRESYTQMIARARSHGIEPVLATEVTMRPPSARWIDRVMNMVGALLGRQAYQDVVNRHVHAMNDWLLETGQRERLLVLHFQSVLSEPGGRRIPAFAQPDGSHITSAGYDALTSYAMPILEEFLVGR